ncbi:MAG: hypothetical protein JW819_05645 [Candidatus Krumholzibacteriota bacterium]|nr:hypothetical protein [Candidatus Krumholzibacteriota bacterium]
MESLSGAAAPYDDEAYRFLLEALERTRQHLGRRGHVSGRELLDGIEELGGERYGPMAALVFAEWGVRDGSDFGKIVYELIDRGVLFRREEDSLEDFLGGRSYRAIFEDDYFSPNRR